MTSLIIPPELDFESFWHAALPWDRFIRPEMQNWALWDGVHRRATVPEWALEAVRRVAPLRLLVIAEDWCGDAVNTVPVLARLADLAPAVELRIIERDKYPALMDRYLTGTARSIPIVIGLDERFRELGHWGPRPAELQAWVAANKATMPKDERYRETRRWYAKDRGETTLREVLAAVGAS